MSFFTTSECTVSVRQPRQRRLVTLDTDRFCGAEALVRWDHPTLGLIPPGLFIPAAEHTTLIRPLTGWVVNAALAECKRWQDDGHILKLALNVSARNLLDAPLPRRHPGPSRAMGPALVLFAA